MAPDPPREHPLPEPEILPPEHKAAEAAQARAASAAMRFAMAFVLALAADVIEMVLMPLFVEGAESPLADGIDVAIAAAMFFLLGWHWEFLPSFAAKLIPGVDLVPLWTLAVANVFRKSRKDVPSIREG